MSVKQAPLFDNTPFEMHDRRAGAPVPLLVSHGLGVNSTAGVILLNRLGDRPDAILFGDTGAEQPETYAYRDVLNGWLRSVGFPEIVTVRRAVDHDRQKHAEKYDTLEEECRVKRCLPSIAYYGRSCSEKWKQQPQEKWANAYAPAAERWGAGKRCVKAIFYDAEEAYRAKVFHNDKWAYWYPLLDHNWGRDECLRAIEAEGLPAPPKSSCFFCSEMTEHEILDLGRRHPDLLQRALAMEQNAALTGIKGLGKHEYSWRELVDGKVPLPAAPRERRPSCVCYDG